MKMSAESFQKLSDMIKPIDTPERREHYDDLFNRGLLNHVKDFNMRYRWDCFWAVPNDVRWPLINHWYDVEKLNDTHIDTALKTIIRGNDK